MAQDLLLFVLFFDLMLIPFFFLFAGLGTRTTRAATGRARIKAGPATIKMVVYTLVGSLLMLAGAIATGVIAGDGGTPELLDGGAGRRPARRGHPATGSSASSPLAFLVKMPAFLVHGWMPDAYRVAPLPALALFSAVLSKVGAYGFLRVVLPIFPAATIQFQEVLLVIAVASILYGSIMAFTQTSARLVARLLLDRAARLHHARDLRPAPRRGRRRRPPDGQPRPGDRAADAAVRPARPARRHRRHRADGRPRPPRPGDGGAVPGRDDGPAGDPRLGQLRRRVLHPQRRLPGRSSCSRSIASVGVAMAAYYALRLYQHAMHNRKRDGHRVAGDRLARGRDHRRAGRVHRGAGAPPAADPRTD